MKELSKTLVKQQDMAAIRFQLLEPFQPSEKHKGQEVEITSVNH